ncbi:MAG: peptide ABC transporter substrate-binding protein [Oscillospiraceae bacterium]
MKKTLSLLFGLVLTVSVLSACGSNQSASLYPGTSGDKQVTVNISSEPPELNSVLTTDTISLNILSHVTENLVTLNPNDEVIPGVAETWEYDESTYSYTFSLRDTMKWSNGEKVTAHDFVFGWKQLLSPDIAAPYGYFAYILENGEAFFDGKVGFDSVGVKATDDYTLVVKLGASYPYALSTFAFNVFAPVNEKAWNELGNSYGKEANTTVTNGAYKLTSWVHEDKVVLEKNSDYYDADKINIEKITMKMISDSNAASNSFKAGELDLIDVQPQQAKEFKDQGLSILEQHDAATAYFSFNLQNDQLKNAKIRKALTLSIDVDSFVTSVLQNSSKVANVFTPGSLQSANGKYEDAQKKADLGYDRNITTEELKALLSEGMAEDGLTSLSLTLVSDDTDNAKKNAAFFQEQWKSKLDIDIQVETVPYKTRLQKLRQKDYQIILTSWGPDYNDPMTFLDLFVTNGGNNYAAYSNPVYDDLIKKASEETDQVKRENHLIAAEKMIVDDFIVGAIYFRVKDYVVSDKLEGVVRTPFSDMNFKFAKLK